MTVLFIISILGLIVADQITIRYLKGVFASLIAAL